MNCSLVRIAGAAAWCLLISTLLNACAGYHLGSIPPKFMDGVHTVAVPTFTNDTLLPRLEVLGANSLIKQIQQDGTYRVVSAENADVIVSCRISDIRRHGARSVKSDVLKQSEFDLTVVVKYIVKKRSTGEDIHTGSTTGSTSFFVSGNDINQDERQAIPLALENAAVHMVSQLSEGW